MRSPRRNMPPKMPPICAGISFVSLLEDESEGVEEGEEGSVFEEPEEEGSREV
jgi:hypothetical protein